MNILAIDTSGPVCGVSIMKDNRIVAEHLTINPKTHSVNLLPMVNQALDDASITINELDRIACVVGPGSFTGVRIGVSTVKGLAHGFSTPCVPVDALEAMAWGAAEFEGIICAIQDARAGQVYAALFSNQADGMIRLMEDKPIGIDELLHSITEAAYERVLFIGDGVPVHESAIRGKLGGNAVIPPPHLIYLRPSSVALLGSRPNQLLKYNELMPMYLRKPSAERNKRLVEAQSLEK